MGLLFGLRREEKEEVLRKVEKTINFRLAPLPACTKKRQAPLFGPSMDDASLGASMLHRSLMTGRGNRRAFEQGVVGSFCYIFGALTFVTRDTYYLLWGDTSELRGSWHHQCIFYVLLEKTGDPQGPVGPFSSRKREKEKDARGFSGCTPHSLGLWQVALVTQRH